MNTRNWLRVALSAVLALGVAACGAKDQADNSSSTVQNTNTTKAPIAVAFNCVPGAQIWVDGVERGSTPAELALEAGSHKVVFQRPGFERDEYEISVHGPTTVDGALVLSRDGDASALAALGQALEIDIETLGEVPVHRGPSDHAVLLYWPREEVRVEGLTTFRIDVSEDYQGDGVLRFVSKSDTLYEEPFDPENMTTIAEIPQQVLDGLKTNSKVKWGLFFDDKRKKDITAEFKVVTKDKVAKQLEKLSSSKHFSRQDPIVQAMMQAEVFLNNQLYTEALQYYLGSLQMWPDSTQPFNGIVKSAQRLDLKETPLYATALQHFRGKGGQAGVKSTGLGVDTLPNALKADGLITKLHGVTATNGKKAMGPGGAGVAPVGGVKDANGNPVDPTVLVPEGDRAELLRHAEMAMLRASAATERSDTAYQAFQAAKQTYEQTQQAANEAQAASQAAAEKLRDLREAFEAVLDSDPDAAQKRDDLGKLIARATEEAKQLNDRALELAQQANDTHAAMEQAQAEADALKQEAQVAQDTAERAKAQAGLPSTFTEHTEPAVPQFGEQYVAEAKKVWEEAEARAQIARDGVTQAETAMEAAKTAAEANPSDPLLAAALVRAIENYNNARKGESEAVAAAHKAQQDYSQAYTNTHK